MEVAVSRPRHNAALPAGAPHGGALLRISFGNFMLAMPTKKKQAKTATSNVGTQLVLG